MTIKGHSIKTITAELDIDVYNKLMQLCLLRQLPSRSPHDLGIAIGEAVKAEHKKFHSIVQHYPIRTE